MDELAQPEYIHLVPVLGQRPKTTLTLLGTVRTNQMLLQFQEMQRLINVQNIIHTAKRGRFCSRGLAGCLAVIDSLASHCGVCL